MLLCAAAVHVLRRAVRKRIGRMALPQGPARAVAAHNVPARAAHVVLRAVRANAVVHAALAHVASRMLQHSMAAGCWPDRESQLARTALLSLCDLEVIQSFGLCLHTRSGVGNLLSICPG